MRDYPELLLIWTKKTGEYDVANYGGRVKIDVVSLCVHCELLPWQLHPVRWSFDNISTIGK